MKYIDSFLEYLLVVKKHSDNTIKNYRVDLLEFNEFINNNLLKKLLLLVFVIVDNLLN